MRRRWIGGLIVLVLAHVSTNYVPSWWQQGWPRSRVGSVAEAELMSQLAVLLMPNTSIPELFRSFPSPAGWGGHSMAPDLAAYGVLQERDAALFLEYDGYWRHGEKEGKARDKKKKKTALLAFAPKGSIVIRISHTREATQLHKDVLWVKVDPWVRRDKRSLLKCLRKVLQKLLLKLDSKLHPSVANRLRSWVEKIPATLSKKGISFAKIASAERCGSTVEEILAFLDSAGFSSSEIQRLETSEALLGRNIETVLKPVVGWFRNAGFTSGQMTNVFSSGCFHIGHNIKQNLEPKTQWLLDLGLNKAQVAKVVLRRPQLLGLRIEQNLEPKRQWLLDLGLSKARVARLFHVILKFFALALNRTWNLQGCGSWIWGARARLELQR